MIFYFSGTGNSRYAAEKIAAAAGCETLSIADSLKNGRRSFELAEGEPLGFVMPVYAWNVPQTVSNFIEGLQLTGAEADYVFAVFTCGANTGLSFPSLKKTLEAKGLALDAAFDIVMPDNYIVMFNPPDEKKERRILAEAEKVLEGICGSVRDRRGTVEIKAKNPPAVFSMLFNGFFNEFCLGTRRFHTTRNCTGCGLCAEVCPVSAIELVNGKPAWQKARCAKCMACINRCPNRALQYGSNTLKRKRYVHPAYRES